MTESITTPALVRASKAPPPPIVPGHDGGSQWVEWMGVRFQVPAEWYIVRHSVANGRGSIALMDRYRQRLEVVWTPCRTKPNVEEILSRYRDRVLPGGGRAEFQPLAEIPRWQGMSERKGPGLWFTRAAYFDAPTSRLIEVTLLNADVEAGRGSLVARVLSSLTVVSDDHNATHWCGFGLDVAVPEKWRLVKTLIQPGDVSFRFRFVTPRDPVDARTTRQTREAVVRRLGMAGLWYQGPEHYFRQRGQIREVKLSPEETGGHAGVLARGGEIGPPLKIAMGLLRRRCDLLWLCPHDNAVYHVLTLGPSDEAVDPRAFRVRCCQWPGGEAGA